MIRKLVIACAVAASVAAGVAAASTVMPASEPPPEPPADARPAAGSASVEAPERQNSGPPYGVLMYNSKTGKTCAVAGHVVDGKVGRVDARDKKFRAFPKAEGPPCVDRTHIPLDAHFTGLTEVEGGNVTLIWGVATQATRIVVTRSSTGERRALTPTKRGAFLTAYEGYPLHDDFRVEATLRSGEVVVQDFPYEPTPAELRAQQQSSK